MPSAVDLKDFLAGFLVEAEEHLHAVDRNLVAVATALKESRPEPAAVRELFRSLHTIKGLAAMVGVEPVVDVAHEMEGILRTADSAGGRLAEHALDLLLHGTRAIEERIHALAKGGLAAVSPAPAPLLEALALAQQNTESHPEGAQPELALPAEVLRALSMSDREQVIHACRSGRRVVLVEFQPSPERAARGFNITEVRSRLGQLGELVKVLPRASAGAPTGIAFGLLLITDADDAALAQAVDGTSAAVEPVTLKEAPKEAPKDASKDESDEAGPQAQSGPARKPVILTKDTDATRPKNRAEADSAQEPLRPQAQAHDEEDWSAGGQTIRVEVRRLDEALEQLSTLVVTRFKMARAAADLGAQGADTRELNAIISENTRQLRRLRAAITKARMVPLAELLQRLPLVVRGLTKDTAKSVDFSLLAGSAEVDKAVADQIFPAVVHLVRNAVDHGIETREVRRAAGKPESGRLSILCDDSSGTMLALQVADDGRGVDREGVARKLGRSAARSDDELLQQIAAPGLSTREGITRASGRGMGMEIVKRSVEALGGSLTLQSAPGKGTTFTLRVPVSITIVDVFSFMCGSETFVAPVAMVDEILEIDPSLLVEPPAPAGEGPVLRLVQRRGQAIPLLPLESVLQGRPETIVPSKALVVRQARGPVAFGVDRMLGQQEAVVRALDDILVRVPGVTGATDLGDGRPTLVLDLGALGVALTQSTARPS